MAQMLHIPKDWPLSSSRKTTCVLVVSQLVKSDFMPVTVICKPRCISLTRFIQFVCLSLYLCLLRPHWASVFSHEGTACLIRNPGHWSLCGFPSSVMFAHNVTHLCQRLQQTLVQLHWEGTPGSLCLVSPGHFTLCDFDLGDIDLCPCAVPDSVNVKAVLSRANPPSTPSSRKVV